ncbi:MAG: hypothetical protein WCO98_09465 [bacterium]
MKIVFVGGGAHRYLSVARSVLAEQKVVDKGEICVYDLNATRANAMAGMIQKSPEFKSSGCIVTCPDSLDIALNGANVVCVVLMAGNRLNYELSTVTCNKYGFIGSDQLSPSGAFLALKGGPILLDIAKRMEKLCPDAWLIDFANPVAVLSATVNNHTKIRCLGVCAGYTNHLWDLSRILGKDEEAQNIQANSAGINHMAFILKDSKIGDEDLYDVINAHIATDWKMPELSPRWNAASRGNIMNSVTTLLRLYKKFGVLVFSSESDGLAHLDIEGIYNEGANHRINTTIEEIEKHLNSSLKSRQNSDEIFQSHLNREMTEAEWNTEYPERLYLLREDQNVMTKIIMAAAGVDELRIATSYPNYGAVAGFKDRTVLEYSQIIYKNTIRAAGQFEIPDVLHGLVSALATHQTLLGDAIATGDPRVLYEALYCYPVKQDTNDAKQLWRELLVQSADELNPAFQKTIEYLI